VDVRTVPGSFGAAEVVDLDPARDVTDRGQRDRLRAALWEHGVVCVRLPRPLTDVEARALAAMIGPVKDPVGRTATGAPLRYSDDRQVIDSGFVLTDDVREALGGGSLGGDDERPGLFEWFHTDDSYTEAPAAATVLHARALPASGGGATRFLGMRRAYELLDPAEQERLDGLRVVHRYDNRGAFPPRHSASGPLDGLVAVRHPVVRAHPVRGTPALYFDLDRADHVEGMPLDEGRALLQRLQDHAEAHAPMHAHHWRPHDVLLWDNASVQHCASGDFPVGEARRFWRYMIEGAAPVPYAYRHAT
jgi:alpha-ketoglutarate-dependent taurine dioxygenase